MRTFPKPLTAENEKYYLSRLRDGDGEARRILIEYNLRLVAHIVKKYQSAEDDMEELISIGTIGLIKAVDTFDQEKARRLSTYAARCVENEILMYMRAKKKYMRETSYYEPIGTDKEGNEIQLLDIMDYISNSFMMPFIALLSAIFIGWVMKPNWIVEEMERGGKHFGRKKLYIVMIKYLMPIIMLVLFLQSTGILNKV